jgi:Ca2+-binding RTX toxin-like protein
MGAPGIIVETDGSYEYWGGTAGDDSFNGSPVGEVFYTGLGDDVVYAGGGSDNVFADLGNDWLSGGTGTDTIIFDRVNTAGNYPEDSERGVSVDLTVGRQDLGAFWGVKTLDSFENVTATYKADKVYGSEEANFVLGLGGDDRLYGRGGDDFLTGDDGNDSISAGAGADEIYAGIGADRLTGGSGADRLGAFNGGLEDDGSRDLFLYEKLSDSGLSAATQDVLFGFFDGATNDRIDLSRIDANGSAAGNGTFRFIGTGSFHATSEGEVQVRATANANEYLVKIDADTDTGSEMTLLVHSTSLLTASDFIL